MISLFCLFSTFTALSFFVVPAQRRGGGQVKALDQYPGYCTSNGYCNRCFVSVLLVLCVCSELAVVLKFQTEEERNSWLSVISDTIAKSGQHTEVGTVLLSQVLVMSCSGAML